MGQATAEIVEIALKSTDPEVRRRAVAMLAGRQAVEPWPWPWPQPRPSPVRLSGDRRVIPSVASGSDWEAGTDRAPASIGAGSAKRDDAPIAHLEVLKNQQSNS